VKEANSFYGLSDQKSESQAICALGFVRGGNPAVIRCHFLRHDGGMTLDALKISPRPLVNVALIGYGNAARIFHAPLISGVPGLRLACICSTKPQAVTADWPLLAVVATPAQVYTDPDIGLVVIATGNESH